MILSNPYSFSLLRWGVPGPDRVDIRDPSALDQATPRCASAAVAIFHPVAAGWTECEVSGRPGWFGDFHLHRSPVRSGAGLPVPLPHEEADQAEAVASRGERDRGEGRRLHGEECQQYHDLHHLWVSLPPQHLCVTYMGNAVKHNTGVGVK